MTPKQWIELLGPTDLPVFRQTERRLALLAKEIDGVKTGDIAAVVLADPLMTLRIIHDANSRKSRHFDTEITTVDHALMMIGVNIFFKNYQGLKTVEDALSNQPRALQTAYMRLQRCLHAAWQARDFAVLHVDIRAEEVQVAALLGEISELLLCVLTPDTALKLQGLRRKRAAAEAELEAIGGSFQKLQQTVLEAWHVPEMTRDLLDATIPARSRHTMLRAALAISRNAEEGWWADPLNEVYATLSELLGQPPERIAAIVHNNAVHAARANRWVPALPAARWLPLLPGEWPPEPDEDELGEACPLPDKQVFRESLKAIEGHQDGTLTLPQMSAQILRGLHTGLGLSRILFAMITPDGKRVKCRFTLGIAHEDALRHFEFNLDGKDLFGQLMGKMQGIWMSADNRERLWPLVQPSLREMIGIGDFYAMSLHAGGKPIGLIYADRGHGICGLDGLTYTDFKMLCLQAARGLAKVKAD
ncbi:MAG: HDOD domain-containing protein [Hydrogenophilaceae bacterium]|nr:HDOD domain-containing protein [Hydrogenophilaceae bacterium]